MVKQFFLRRCDKLSHTIKSWVIRYHENMQSSVRLLVGAMCQVITLWSHIMQISFAISTQ